MPNSYTFFKNEVRDWMIQNVPTDKKLLDVGPGQGTYSALLRELGYKMDAIEIWEPYVNEYNLREKYENVHLGDIINFNFEEYDFIILGDVLEHLTTEDAQNLINRINSLKKECLVAIPYQMEQDGEEYGNIYETHLQPDLTHDVMKQRYPDLVPIFTNQYYGYYVMLNRMVEKAYVLYATPSYKDTVEGCVASLKRFSEIPVIVYMLNSDVKIEGTKTIRWNCPAEDVFQRPYIDRKDPRIYHILIQRPLVVKDALKYAKTVCYVDADSVATPQVDGIFDMFDQSSTYPYFVEGIYEHLIYDGKSNIEEPILKLFGVTRTDMYRQTGFFVANQQCIRFLDEWWWMCNNPEIIYSPFYYAPFHEETVANVLLWKYNYTQGLPYIYINGSLDRIDEIYFTGENNLIREWVKIPASEDKLLFFHGEKKKDVMLQMINKLDDKLRVLFLAPHLSTGGMPAFLLKRIESLGDSVNIYVVEHSDLSPHYIVQKEKIKKLVKHFYTLGDNKLELIDIIKNNQIDIVHIDDVSEGIDQPLAKALFDENRTWRIIETCHNISFNPHKNKIWIPDAFAFCTPYHETTFANIASYSKTITFPIDPSPVSDTDRYEARMKLQLDLFKKHVINVGLWTPGKNQKEGIEIARRYPEMQFHFIGNQAPNFAEYWQPLMENLPRNVRVWGERDDIDVFMKAADVFMFNSTWECNPLVLREAISYGLPIMARDLPQYENMFTDYIHPMHSYMTSVLSSSYEIPTDNTSKEFAQKHIDLYKTVKEMSIKEQEDFKYRMFLIDGLFFELVETPENKAYTVKMYDGSELLYKSEMTKGMWSRTNRQYLSNYIVEIWDGYKLLKKINYLDGIKGKRMFISFESSCLGDSIAWIPYCLEFKKMYECDVVVSTFKNFLFEETYPELEFVGRGVTVDNIYGSLKIGWFYNKDKEPVHPATLALQKAICNIIRVPFVEIQPRIAFTPKGRPIEEKYITIATQSTAQCKLWYYWTELIEYFHNKGYKIVEVSKDQVMYDNLINPEDTSLETTMNYIHHSEFFIGLSSGLSWLSWGIGKHIVMISNFTEEGHEFTSNCTRIIKKDVCHGCWNNANFLFDKGDWNWCPIYKGTDRAFECHTQITSQQVIDAILTQGLID